jgi:fluoroacetyl-CoA thioesterase
MSVEPGMDATVERTVTEADTAMALGSGTVQVLGTPAVVALCELAAVHAVSGVLDANETTVGVHVDVEHLAPTLPGSHVRAYAHVDEVDGRRIRFRIEASDPSGVIARGSHVRVRVDRKRFMAGAEDRGLDT